MLYYLDKIIDYFNCDKYKKLYEEEKQKYKDLKTCYLKYEEKVISSNKEILEQVKKIKTK